MRANEIITAIAGLCVSYTYAGYPLLMLGLARWRKAPSVPGQPPESFSVVLTSYNEPTLPQRIDDLTRLIEQAALPAELIVVMDGPSGVIPSEQPNLQLIRLPQRRGKAFALSAGCAAATNEILVFADTRQAWEPGAMRFLLNAFSDARVGAVSGELLLASNEGASGGVGIYWHYEKWIRRMESQFYSTVGATGAISAARRSLFNPLPEGLILDDVYWPLQICMQGYRAVFEERARAFDRLPPNARDEFRRKVRTLSGNFQLVQYLPTALVPWRNPLWGQLVSHKLMRLVVPWALLAMLIFSAGSVNHGMRLFFAVQCSGYVVALIGFTRVGNRFRPAATAGAFLLLNAAAFVALWVWIVGRAGRSWTRIDYAKVSPAPV